MYCHLVTLEPSHVGIVLAARVAQDRNSQHFSFIFFLVGSNIGTDSGIGRKKFCGTILSVPDY